MLFRSPKSIRSLENCLKFAKNLPQKDDPEIFGLSEAASLSYLSNDALTIRSMLLTLVPHAARDLVEVKENEVTAKAQGTSSLTILAAIKLGLV